MRRLLCKRNLSGLLFAAMAAGTITVPAVAAQSASSPAKKPIHKHSSSAGATHSSNAPTTTKSTKPAGHKGSGKKRSAKVKGQAAPTSGRISEIQDALAKKGVFTGEPSGKWDESTVEAMKKFQSSNGLNPTGKLDALTLQKLGLGSQTAGRAAPTPPPNSSNRLRNLSSLPSDPNPSN